MNSRDIVLQLAQEKAEEVLSVNLSTFTFNDTIVFALEAENEFPEVNRVDSLRALKAEKNGEIYATLLFSEDDVTKNEAEFFGQSYDPWERDGPDDGSVYVPPEGKIIMLFTKPA
jgi:hypothetical protein